jgi:hypothetical protein
MPEGAINNPSAASLDCACGLIVSITRVLRVFRTPALHIKQEHSPRIGEIDESQCVDREDFIGAQSTNSFDSIEKGLVRRGWFSGFGEIRGDSIRINLVLNVNSGRERAGLVLVEPLDEPTKRRIAGRYNHHPIRKPLQDAKSGRPKSRLVWRNVELEHCDILRLDTQHVRALCIDCAQLRDISLELRTVRWLVREMRRTGESKVPDNPDASW